MRFVALIPVVVSGLLTNWRHRKTPRFLLQWKITRSRSHPTSAPHLNTKITSFAALDGDLEFVICILA